MRCNGGELAVNPRSYFIPGDGRVGVGGSVRADAVSKYSNFSSLLWFCESELKREVRGRTGETGEV